MIKLCMLGIFSRTKLHEQTCVQLLLLRYKPTEENALAISALHGHGLEELKEEIEKKILTATGKKILTVDINLEGPQLR